MSWPQASHQSPPSSRTAVGLDGVSRRSEKLQQTNNREKCLEETHQRPQCKPSLLARQTHIMRHSPIVYSNTSWPKTRHTVCSTCSDSRHTTYTGIYSTGNRVDSFSPLPYQCTLLRGLRLNRTYSLIKRCLCPFYVLIQPTFLLPLPSTVCVPRRLIPANIFPPSAIHPSNKQQRPYPIHHHNNHGPGEWTCVCECVSRPPCLAVPSFTM